MNTATRRRFITLLGGAAAAASPRAARAQQTAKPAEATSEIDPVLQQAKALGAPVAAVQRAIPISRQPIFPKKDALAVFDISQPSAKKRFYVLDLKSAQVTAHYAAMEETTDPMKSHQIQEVPEGPGYGAARPAEDRAFGSDGSL